MTRNYQLSLGMLIGRQVYIRSQSLKVCFIYILPFYLLQKRSRRCRPITKNTRIRPVELSMLVEDDVMTVLRRYQLDGDLYQCCHFSLMVDGDLDQCCHFPLMVLESSLIRVDVSTYGTQLVGRRSPDRCLQKTINPVHCLPLTYPMGDMLL